MRTGRAGFGVPTLQRGRLRCEGQVRNQPRRMRWSQWRQQEARPLVPSQIGPCPLVCLQNAGQSSQGPPTPHGPATLWRAKERVEGHLAQETSEPSHPTRSGEPQTPGLISGRGDRLKLSGLFIKSVPGTALTPWLPRPH